MLLAISKILHMKDSGTSYHGAHLKKAIDYILNTEKTQNGRYAGAINCQLEKSFEQMRKTKEFFGKNNKRQGYHVILSFKEGEVEPEKAFEVTQKFVKEYIGNSYEAVYAVHDNTDHVHSHIIFNSVSFVDGKKFHYKKGDWANEIQPITNRLCKEYGLSVLDFEENSYGKQYQNKEWAEKRGNTFPWSEMIKRDLDACILQAASFESFVDLLMDKGYEIKTGKYFAIRPPGMSRFKRTKSLGEKYEEDELRNRIISETLSMYQKKTEKEFEPKIIKCYVRRYKKAKMSGIQKKYYARLYRFGNLKKQSYSQAWKHKDEIKRMRDLQEHYLFLTRHDIHSMTELAATIQNLTDKRKETGSEKSEIYSKKGKFMNLFRIAEEMKELELAEKAFQSGDVFFNKEHERWINLENKLNAEGYSMDEALKLKDHFAGEIRKVNEKEAAVRRELKIARQVWTEVLNTEVGTSQKIKRDEIEKEIKNQQPRR